MTEFIGILDGGGNCYGVWILDLPGCYGGGATPEEAITDATSAAREWVAHRETKSKIAAEPRSLAQVLNSEKINVTSKESAVTISLTL